MKARLPKGYGRPDPNAMMRQVQKMQDMIETAHSLGITKEELNEMMDILYEEE